MQAVETSAGGDTAYPVAATGSGAEVAATGESRAQLPEGDCVLYVKVLACGDHAVPAARAFARDVFGKHPHAHAAELIISELVTNAMRHTRSGLRGGQVVVEIAYYGDFAHLAVIDDGGPGTPNFAPLPEGLAIGGRGLPLVAAFAEKTGWHRGIQGRRVVWAQLGALPAEASP